MGLKLKIKRIEKGYTQIELSKRVGISRYYLSAIERGRANNPSLGLMRRIANILDTPIEDIFF